MTRKQIKEIITDIIHDVEPFGMEESFVPWSEAENAAERIMKLWDQGFVYEVDR